MHTTRLYSATPAAYKTINDMSLPAFINTQYIIYAPMSRTQRELYDAVKRKDFTPLAMQYRQSVVNTGGSNQGVAAPKIQTAALLNILMQLRKTCNHPFLINEFQAIDGKDTELDENGYSAVDRQFIRECEEQSGKFGMMVKMLRELKKRGHKVLIFSLMTRMLDVMEDYFETTGETYCRIDGSVDQQTRQQQIERFNTDPNVFVFLLSTRAGGLGINLTAADTVIIYDSDWNPQVGMFVVVQFI